MTIYKSVNKANESAADEKVDQQQDHSDPGLENDMYKGDK